MRKAIVPLIFVVVLAAAGCGSSSGSGSSQSTSTAGSGGTTAPGGSGGSGGSGDSACSKYTGGKDGVIRTFCDGTGTVKVTVDGAEHEIHGVSCVVEAGYFTVNGGVVVGPDFSGAKPDYAGFLLPEKGGPFTNATLALDVAGKGHALTKNSGTLDLAGKRGSFTGTDLGSGATLEGTFSC